jgi:hypothetical protein
MSFFFTKMENRRAEQILSGGVGTSPVGEGEPVGRGWEGEYGANTVYMCVNGKMTPVKTIPGIWGRVTKESDGGINSIMIYCKNFYKYHNVPPAQQ